MSSVEADSEELAEIKRSFVNCYWISIIIINRQEDMIRDLK